MKYGGGGSDREVGNTEVENFFPKREVQHTGGGTGGSTGRPPTGTGRGGGGGGGGGGRCNPEKKGGGGYECEMTVAVWGPYVIELEGGVTLETLTGRIELYLVGYGRIFQ